MPTARPPGAEFEHIWTTFGGAFSSIGLQLGARRRRLANRCAGWRAASPTTSRGTPTERPWRTRPAYLAGRAARARHFSLRLLGHRPGTLLRFGGHPAGEWPRSKRGRAGAGGIPLDVLDHPSDVARRSLAERGLVLIRPDQHVAWRGNRPPHDPDMLWSRLVGAT